MKEGDKVDEKCPECNTEMIFEMSYSNAFSYKTGHYTMDRPLKVCPKCDFHDEYDAYDHRESEVKKENDSRQTN